MHYLRYFLVLLLLVTFAFNDEAQNLNIDETIQYINTKINQSKIAEDVNATFNWDLSNDGKLTITKTVIHEKPLIQSVYLKSLDTNTILLNNNNPQPDYYYSLEISCIQKKTDVTKTYTREQKISGIFIRFLPDQDLASRLKNAIIYLIRKGYERSDFKASE